MPTRKVQLSPTSAADGTEPAYERVNATNAAIVAIEGAPANSGAFSAPPGSDTAITPNDNTDITAIASMGLEVTVSGSLSTRSVNTPSVTVTRPVVAGQYVWGRFSRVMAATTATVIGKAP